MRGYMNPRILECIWVWRIISKGGEKSLVLTLFSNIFMLQNENGINGTMSNIQIKSRREI
jgi:hypothetical protein